ncbi:hypothetical protein FRZ00_14745 [Streptomyces mobaraensis]|uniref:Uncharacterized protein n=1 Tax=Streptomyces mobaraensis TaxID=35621 RepID=A0A5N5W973_STRMB|nr:hypothetical protein FRZ00_14745 [Streptomyces mobaraensis]
MRGGSSGRRPARTAPPRDAPGGPATPRAGPGPTGGSPPGGRRPASSSPRSAGVTRGTPRTARRSYTLVRVNLLVKRRHVDFLRVTSMSCRLSG